MLTSSFFRKEFAPKFNSILWFSLVSLILYRIILVFDSAKGIHLINLFALDLILLFFTSIGILLIFLMSTRSDLHSPFFSLSVIQLFFASLYMLQFIIDKNPIVIQSDDIYLILFQFITLFIFLILINLHGHHDVNEILRIR